MSSSKLLPLLLCLLLVPDCLVRATTVSNNGRAIIIAGQRRVLISGSIHYPRSTPQMWPDLIQKAKEGGLDAIETYVLWNAHEPQRRQYNFQGNADLVRFIREIQNAGLYAVLRIGPYACAEWNYGGIPAWLRQIPGLQFRTDNQPWKDEMQNFTTLIVDMLKTEKLLAPQGGPIILAQIENEYGNVEWSYGDAGKRYVKWCANLAESYNLGIPWIMCQQGDAPPPMINTCNGFYCDGFYPNNHNSPKMFTENWSGWFKAWDKPDYHRLVEDLAFSVAKFFQYQGTFMNYYMYHGGTNFGRTSGGPYITTSYDYDAPLDEYGNLRQPKWGHLKNLHAAIKLMERALTYGDFNDTPMGNGVSVTRYTANGTSSCFISNSIPSADATLKYEGNEYFLPAWSVRFLPDCKQEVYNTAKVNTQTSIMVKKSNQEENEPGALKWSWRSEPLKHFLSGKGGSFSANKLQEQITTAADGSDYLWYITSQDIATAGPMTLHVSTAGHVLHAFVNGKLVGSQYAPNGGFKFVFEREVQLTAGTNNISLLSGTVGLKNYGAQYELEQAGIVGGPVKLFEVNRTIDLSTNTWSYKIGLWGMDKKFYRMNPKQESSWESKSLSTKRPFTWYKTTFKTPQGSEPVVVDMLGMGKGEAWVNGQSIGRFWPNYTTAPNGCSWCNYKGPFKQDSCRTGCGQPAQRCTYFDQPWKDEMQNFTTLIVDMLKTEKLLAPQGGPIILAQIENEYGNVEWSYGDAGKRYVKWCANLAESYNLGIPWIMCQQGDAPPPMINTCNGFYYDGFYPNNHNSPKMFTENWSGWFKAWDKPDYHRLVEDLAFSVAKFFQYQGTFMNYYMYHGGTNFGRTSGGPYITTSYDYDAPLDEYGNLRQPKWGHLKNLHAAIKLMERALAYGDFNDTPMGNGVSVTRYTANGTSSCFISNSIPSADATLKYEGNEYFLPAWSVSFLSECKQEVYNTAKVNTQTSIMVKKPNQEENEPRALKWSWRSEPLKHFLSGKGGSFSANKLQEQITTAADGSDYLWYITSQDIATTGPMTLHVSTAGHVLHAFVNGKLVGSQYAPNGGFKFVFEREVQLTAGTNYISLLSGTVGLKNYGAQYELEQAGIAGGPVKLIEGNRTIDLSTNIWSYKIGLWGMDKKFYRVNPKQESRWESESLSTKRPFTWYKTTFKTPQGSEPVVVDLLGMGKGEAWVNGQSIGRFWPNYTTAPNGCSPCNYKGPFKQDSCRTGCGQPAQRWYHIPRSFLNEDVPNTLTLFEEAGGDPSQVTFQIVTAGTICVNALEGSTVTLSCQGGQAISGINFASFGNPQGSCQSFKRGTCEATDTLSIVQKACVGQISCSINVNEATLGAAPSCKGITKRLAVQAFC